MADNPKAAWPKTPDGTTDWEYVFEDASSGFIPLIAQVQSPEALQMGATVILEKLFTRKNDEDERTRLIGELNAIIKGGGSIDNLMAQVARLMREVKDERIEKARVYLERKQAGAAIDRRAGMFWKLDTFLKPKVLIPLVVVFVLMLSGLVYLLLHSTLSPGTDLAGNTLTPAELAIQDAAKKAAEEAAATAASTDALPAPEPEPIPVLFQTLRWPLSTEFTTDKPQYYSVVLYVRNWDQKVEICRRLPAVMDRFYTSFSDDMPAGRPAKQEELDAVAAKVKQGINALLPEPFVLDAAVARYGTREFRIAPRPPYCMSPNP